LESISNKLNPFWRDILLNLSELLPPKDEEENNIINILSQPIWLNCNIKRNGIFFISQDIFSALQKDSICGNFNPHKNA
jgi:hypothetical protein